MAGDVRQRMAAGAALQLAKRGLQATSFATVLAATGAPRGSVYHHFPAGKDQLVAAAMDVAAGRTMAALDEMSGSPADVVTLRFFGLWRMVLERSGLTAGCAMVAVTVATDSADLLDRAGTVFRNWRARLSELLEIGGLAASDASRMAAVLVAAGEGAVLLARAEQSMEPFELVAASAVDQVRALLSAR